MRHNKGFTLIELIVVIMIMAISAAVVVSSISSVYTRNMQQCAIEIDALLSRCRISAMSRAGNVYLELWQGTDGIYAAYCESGGGSGDIREEEKVGKSMLSITWTDSGGTTHDLSAGSLYLAFDRGTGALLPLSRSFAMASDTFSPLLNCTDISVTHGTSQRTVVLVPVTGKHYISAD